jgi:RHS repeat-associated protein
MSALAPTSERDCRTRTTGENCTASEAWTRTKYAYDKASNRTGFTDPESGSTVYVYDTLNRLQTLTPPSTFTSGNFGFSYDALSRRTQMTRPNSVSTVYAYDNLSRLTSALHQLSGSTIDGASYTVDNAGNRTAKTDQRAGVTSNYAYDAIYELTGVTQGGTTTESYTFDPVGNRESSLGVSPYSLNGSNELTSTPSTTYTHDANGNTSTEVVSSATTTFAWDYENRLTSVTLPGSGGTVSFKYDPFGRRIEKTTSGTTSIYAYDGDNLVEETNSAGSVVARYEQTQNIDEPLAMLRSSTTSYYDADGLGSITSLSSSAGALAQTYGYDSFGKQTSASGSLTNPFQYTGRELDPETSLYYYRARYYDQNTARFLSEDNTRFDEGVNFYSYVYNEPTDYSDPSGLRKYKCNAWGVCYKIPFGWKPYRPPPSPNPNSAGLSLVNQQLQAYRDCVASGIKAFPGPPPLPPDPLYGMPKGLYDLKPNAHPMPGDPGGVFAFPDPKPSPIGAPDGLAVVNDLMQRYACWKRGKVADACGDRFPLAKLSPEF